MGLENLFDHLEDLVWVEGVQSERKDSLADLVQVQHIVHEGQGQRQLTLHVVAVLVELLHKLFGQVRIGEEQRKDEVDEEKDRVERSANFVTHKGTERFGLLSLHLFFTERDLVEEVLHLLGFVAKEYCDNRLAQIEHLRELDLDETRLSLLHSSLNQLASGDVHAHVNAQAGRRAHLDHLVVLVLSR